MDSGSNTKTKVLIAVIVLLIGVIGFSVYLLYSQKSTIADLKDEATLTKQELEDEYESLSVQYEGFKLNLQNDSLLQQLDNEQAKVQRLLDELKIVKAENRTEINRLKKELSTLRSVLKSYIVQIDSLNQVNERLAKENEVISSKYKQSTHALSEITRQRESLSHKVTLAAKLDATNINVLATNKKGKSQKKIEKVELITVNFIITKNITAEPGERIIYVRIKKPDDEVLTKSPSNVFKYENRDINYSMKRVVEYGGEEVNVSLYWTVEEYLQPGTYRVDIFADGNLIGNRSIELTK